MRKGWSSWRRLRGDLINAYKHLKTGSQVDGARHFPVLCSNKTNGNRHKLEHKMIHMDKRKSFFTTIGLERAAQGGCGLSFSRDIHAYLDTSLCNLENLL